VQQGVEWDGDCGHVWEVVVGGVVTSRAHSTVTMLEVHDAGEKMMVTDMFVMAPAVDRL